MNTAYLSLGSNLGDRVANLAAAVRLLQGVAAVSSVYETVPQGKTDQPDFLNLAVQVRTALDPLAYLHTCQEVERSLGRVRKERWGPRSIDIDIALWNQERVALPDLAIPHPRVHERAFVMIPVLELDGEAAMPDGTALRDLLRILPDQGVRRFQEATAFLAKVRGVQ